MGPYTQVGLPPSSAGGFLSSEDPIPVCDRDAESADLGSLLWLVVSPCGPPDGDPMQSHHYSLHSPYFSSCFIGTCAADTMILSEMIKEFM